MEVRYQEWHSCPTGASVLASSQQDRCVSFRTAVVVLSCHYEDRWPSRAVWIGAQCWIRVSIVRKEKWRGETEEKISADGLPTGQARQAPLSSDPGRGQSCSGVRACLRWTQGGNSSLVSALFKYLRYLRPPCWFYPVCLKGERIQRYTLRMIIIF